MSDGKKVEYDATLASAGATVGDSLEGGGAPARAVEPGGADRPGSHFVRGRELARGGMGRIVIAEDSRLERTVALKLLQRVSPVLRARFEREATITARLAHPAIVPVYERGELDNGEPFYVMKLVDGTPLDAAIAKAADLPARLGLLSSAMAVCEALAYAHSRRIIHRDLKPANVLVGRFGETVVIDWGIAKDLAAAELPVEPGEAATDGSVTLDGEIVGTPSYMPPEQASGAGVDERADVYALGALLYHVIAGRPPYLGKSVGEILAAVEAGPPPSIATLEPEVPDDLASIIAKAMARAPADRYPSAGELAEELRRFIDGRLVSSHRYSGAELVRRWLRKHRAAVAVGAVALCVLTAGGVVSVRKIVARERETARALAESRLEQGRQLLVGGDPGQATPFLAAALDELPDDPVAQRLAAIAIRDGHRLVGTYAGTTAAFRRDGRELAIGRADGTIEVVDATSGTGGRVLPSLGGAIARLAYAPDDRQLAVASPAGAELRDAGTGARVLRLTTEPAREVAWLGDRVVVATASAVMLVASDGRVLATQPAEDPRALVVDGTAIVAMTRDAALALGSEDLHVLQRVPHGEANRFGAILDRGALVTAGSDGLRRWGEVPETLVAQQVVPLVRVDEHTIVAGGMLVGSGPAREIARDTIQVAAVLDPTHVILGGYDRTLRVWDLARPARPGIVLDAAAATELLVADPTGQRAVSRGALPDAAIELWDVGRARAPLKSVAMGADIEWILADHRDRIAVHLHDGPTRLLTGAFEPVATVAGWPVGFRPDGDELATDTDGRIMLYDARTGARLREIAEPDPIWHVAYSASGRSVATSSDRKVTLRDASWRARSSFESTAISAIAVDDGGHVVTGHEDGTIRIWDASTGTLLGTASGHTTHVGDLELRGETLASSSWDLTRRRWAVPSGASRGILKRFDRAISALAVSPAGGLMATADGSGAASLYDGEQGRMLEQLPSVDGLVSVTFTDENHLVVGGTGGRLELLDLAVRAPGVSQVVSPRWRLENGRAVERR